MQELTIKKCLNCGATIKVIDDCHCDNCGIMCCGQAMKTLVANASDGAIEKHKPEISINNGLVTVNVNHVMEESHFIKQIVLVAGEYEFTKSFVPGETPRAVFPYISGSKVYALCNKHGLWETDIQ